MIKSKNVDRRKFLKNSLLCGTFSMVSPYNSLNAKNLQLEEEYKDIILSIGKWKRATLLSGLKIGIFKELPDKKTNTELNKMLKRDLIELVQIYQS